MKIIAPLLLLAFVSFTQAADRIDEKAPATPVVEPTPKPAAILAPDGVFYLLATARVGLHVLPPGTEVKLVRPGIYLTPVGEASLDVEQLTNELGKVRAAKAGANDKETVLHRTDMESSAPSAAVTRIKDSIVWQKSPDGKFWRSIKRVDGSVVSPPRSEPVE